MHDADHDLVVNPSEDEKLNQTGTFYSKFGFEENSKLRFLFAPNRFQSQLTMKFLNHNFDLNRGSLSIMFSHLKY